MEEEQKRKVNWSRVLLAVFIVLGIGFIVGPGLLGYGVYLQIKDSNFTVNELGQNIHALERQLEVSQANLSLQGTFNSNLLEMVEKNTNSLLACQTERSKLEAENKYAGELCEQRNKVLQQLLEEVKEDKQEEESLEAQEKLQTTLLCTTDLELKKKQLEDLQLEFNVFVQNMARSVCCKQKIDNPQINSYSVSNNKLVCQEGGGTPVTCTLQ